MSQTTEIYTLTGKKIGVITQGKPEQYTLTGIKIETGSVHTDKKETGSTDKKETGSTDKKETISDNIDKKDTTVIKK